MLDELGGPKTYNHYPNGWAMAFNTPFKMWKRYEFNGGTCDPCIISWPAGIDGQAARSATSTTTRSTSCRRSSTCSASSRPRRSRATPRARSTASACATASTTPTAPSARKTQFYSMLGSRGDLARRLEGRHDAPDDRAAGATSTTTSGSCTTPTSTAPSCTTSPPSTPRSCASSSNLWFAEAGRQQRVPARRPLGARDHHHPAAAAHRAARTATSTTPDTAEVPESQAVNIRNRSFAIGALVDIPAPGAAGVLFAHGLPLRRPRPLRQGQPAALRQQLRRHASSRRSSAPRTSRPART